MKSKAIDIIAAHVVTTLPDSIQDRTEVLDALLSILPVHHQKRKQVSDVLYHLNAHNIAQRELALEFATTTTTKGNGK